MRDEGTGQGELFPTGHIKPREIRDKVDITVSRHRGADTSSQAFGSTPPSVRKLQRDLVLDYIRRQDFAGATCEEASQDLGIAYTAASARITQLQAIGAIRYGNQRRKTTRGRNARVYYST